MPRVKKIKAKVNDEPNMKNVDTSAEYCVTLSITYDKTVKITAKSAEKAAKKAIKGYKKGKIVVAKGKPTTRQISVSQPDMGYYEDYSEF